MLLDDNWSKVRDKTKPSRRNSITSQDQISGRKRERMSIGQEVSKPTPTRQYINGVPLLLDLNEILNIDVSQMAIKEIESRKSRHKRRKVLPEKDEESDPSIYVEERLTFLSSKESGTAEAEETKEEI